MDDSKLKKKVGNERKEIDIEEVRMLYCDEKLSLLTIAEYYGYSSSKPIKRALKNEGIEIRPSGFQEIEIDPEEVYRLYFDEGLSMTEMVGHFECKSSSPILRVMEENDWKSKYKESLEIIESIDPDEVYRLYHEEGLSHRKIGEYYGISFGPIRRMFKENNWEYDLEIEVDPEKVHQLYVEQKLTMEDTGEALGVSKSVIKRALKEQELEIRSSGPQEIEIDHEKFCRLYYEEELPMMEIAENLEVSVQTLKRYRKKHDMEIRDLTRQDTEIDYDIFCQLYYEGKLPLGEIAEILEASQRTLKRYRTENNMETRSNILRNVEIEHDEFCRLYYEEELSLREIAEHLEVSEGDVKRYRKNNLEIRSSASVYELREMIFGMECVSCGKPRRDIHKKDGKPHKPGILWSKNHLKKLNPDDWVALCSSCHRLTHSLMNVFSCKWDDIEEIVKELRKKYLS